MIFVNANMLMAGARACSQWVNGKKKAVPQWDSLNHEQQVEYMAQAQACLTDALKTDRPLIKGDVVQLNEKCGNPMLRYCFMTVTEPKGFGAMGFIQCTGENQEVGGRAYYRAKFEEMDLIGCTNLLPADEVDDET